LRTLALFSQNCGKLQRTALNFEKIFKIRVEKREKLCYTDFVLWDNIRKSLPTRKRGKRSDGCYPKSGFEKFLKIVAAVSPYPEGAIEGRAYISGYSPQE
jgi:hypothetical protein